MENNLNTQARKELLERLLEVVNSAEEYYYLQSQVQNLSLSEAVNGRASHFQAMEVAA